MEITERFLARCDLTEEELKVARYFYSLSSAGKKTKAWAKNLGPKKFMNLSISMLRKIRNRIQSTG